MVLSELQRVGTMETSFRASVGRVKESKGNEVPAMPSGTGTLNVRLVFVLLLPCLGWFGHARHPRAPPGPLVSLTLPLAQEQTPPLSSVGGARSHLRLQRPTGPDSR